MRSSPVLLNCSAVSNGLVWRLVTELRMVDRPSSRFWACSTASAMSGSPEPGSTESREASKPALASSVAARWASSSAWPDSPPDAM